MAGKWDYRAGSGNATVQVPSGAKVFGIRCQGGMTATCQIGNGDEFSIQHDPNIRPLGFLLGPIDIVFISSEFYFVDWVSE